MERMGTFFKYLVWFLLTFAIVTFIAWNLMDFIYEPVKEGDVSDKYFKFENVECKATNVNGYIEGNIKNTTTVNVEYLKMIVELFDDNKVKIGEVEEEFFWLRGGETRDFKLYYYFDNVKEYNIKWTRQKES